MYLPVAVKTFDLAVNVGARQAHKIVQRAARAHGRALIDDGDLGPNSRSALRSLGNADILPAIRSEAAGFYRGLVAARPRSSKYLDGWLNRAYA